MLYLYAGMLCLEMGWVVTSCIWFARHLPATSFCSLGYRHRSVMVGLIISSNLLLAILLTFTWCAWDKAGSHWYKLVKYQRSVQENQGKLDRYTNKQTCFIFYDALEKDQKNPLRLQEAGGTGKTDEQNSGTQSHNNKQD